MSARVNKKASFRLRGFTCRTCDFETLTFGNDTPGSACPNCAAPIDPTKPQWDQVVTELTTVTPYVAPQSGD